MKNKVIISALLAISVVAQSHAMSYFTQSAAYLAKATSAVAGTARVCAPVIVNNSSNIATALVTSGGIAYMIQGMVNIPDAVKKSESVIATGMFLAATMWLQYYGLLVINP